MTLREPVTAEDFERYALLPENAHKRLKLVEGHVIDAGLNWWSSVVNARLSSAVLDYLLNENDIGWVTGPGCGYAVGGERYLPNMAYHCYERFPKPTGEYYPPVAPTIAVEIIMGIPGEEAILGVQLRHYLAAGSTVWIVRPDDKAIEMHAPGCDVQYLQGGDTLTQPDILPGFQLKISDLFE